MQRRPQFLPDGSRLSRREFLAAGFGLAGVVALGVGAGCAARDPLRISLQDWSGFQFLRLAEAQGWFADEPLQLVPATTIDDVRRSLADGSAQGAALTLDEVIRLRDGGIPLQVCMVFDVSVGADVVLARPGIATPADLKGKRIGVEDTPLGTLVLSEVLTTAGLRRNDVVVVPIDEDHLQAWLANPLDAVLTYGVSAAALEARGLVRLLDSRNFRSVIFDVLAVRSDRTLRHGSALRTLITGHFRALAQWQHNPIDTMYRLAAQMGVAPEDVRRVLKGLDLPDLQYNRQVLSPPQVELQRAAQAIAEVLLREGMLTARPDLDALFTADYLPKEVA